MWAGRNGLHLHPLGCSYHLHFCHRFLSTWGVVMLKKQQQQQQQQQKTTTNDTAALGVVRISLTFERHC